MCSHNRRYLSSDMDCLCGRELMVMKGGRGRWARKKNEGYAGLPASTASKSGVRRSVDGVESSVLALGTVVDEEKDDERRVDGARRCWRAALRGTKTTAQSRYTAEFQFLPFLDSVTACRSTFVYEI